MDYNYNDFSIRRIKKFKTKIYFNLCILLSNKIILLGTTLLY